MGKYFVNLFTINARPTTHKYSGSFALCPHFIFIAYIWHNTSMLTIIRILVGMMRLRHLEVEVKTAV